MSDIIFVVSGLASNLDEARSFLIFPGDDEHKRQRALGSGADAVVLDLEDGVAEARKGDARLQLAAFASSAAGPALLVRINPPVSEDGSADLRAVAGLGDVAVVVPKASIAAVEAAAVAAKPLIALVEDAAGVRDAYALAEHPSVVALALGSADLSVALGLLPVGDGSELLVARSQLVLASAAARIRPPIDGPCLDVRNPLALEAEAARARALGLRGKLCIHPGQVNGVHRAFAPTEAELEHARRVVRAWDDILAEGRAVGMIDGSMVDLPVALRARAVIEASERSQTA